MNPRKVPFTGADSKFFEPTKEQMKVAAVKNNIKTPAYAFAFKTEDITPATKLNYPLIVKHFNGSGSIGTSKDSKVWNAEQLQLQASKMITEHGGALIEEFIEGKEYTVLVAENIDDEKNPMAFVPVECAFPEGADFKHFDMKWVDFEKLKWIPCKDAILAEKLKDMSKKIFLAMDGVGYGRTDLRVNKNGEPYFLEINSNCGIFSPMNEEGSAADFILMYDDMKHRGFAEHIIKAAIARCERLKNRANQSTQELPKK